MNSATADSGSTTMTDQTAASQHLVVGGIARYLDADVTLVRLIIAALALLNGVGLALYIAAWLLIPLDGEDQSLAAAWIAARRNRSR